MALVACPDCGKQISEAAPTCVGCGRPAPSTPKVSLTSVAPKLAEAGYHIPSLTELTAIAGGTLYTVGFVVANEYYARYGLVRFDFFRGRYAAAALLYASAALFPGYTGWRVGTHFRLEEKRRVRKRKGILERCEPPSQNMRRRDALVMLVAGAFLASLLLWPLLNEAAVARVPFLWVVSFAFVAQWPFATAGSLAAKIRWSPVSARSDITSSTDVHVLLHGCDRGDVR
jgi:hypothetical protein